VGTGVAVAGIGEEVGVGGYGVTEGWDEFVVADGMV